MNIAITASLKFSFKGESFSPSVAIDLDAFFEHNSNPDLIDLLLANSNNIDIYSYAYEVMQASDIIYSDATGLAAKYLNEGKFDFLACQKDWQYHQDLAITQNIAQKHLAVNDLQQQPQLRDALLEALNR